MKKEKHAQFEISQGAIIENKDGTLLLLKLRDGFWALPGGHLHKNEAWLDGLKREIYEETGLDDLSIICTLGVCTFKNSYGVRFHCTTPQKEVTLSNEHDNFVWVTSKKDVDKYQFHHPALKEFVVEVLAKR